ncbi:CDP-glycerol glycerophosphotransferase family protein [Kineothrix sp. MSJ-39]|uniref:CDP-glycerol glycerophosphotransferase family protein n=1 Tax=Kineothrix sp. MSJ-39 TaxID=2841533 RepID=UPI001C10796E|nr:CDP-glycerol glycerophosphotransferase family protein [Kineothrix sp. MSJ-39]MBU5429191.1 CDP-glycerol glycerophosphotransferase family protein [Kineothrix sp. MSJ-39]
MEQDKRPPMFRHRYMAHAFGGYQGYKYTNTKEAFAHAIACGFRCLETDLFLTTDDQLVCSHGFKEEECLNCGLPYEPWYKTEMTREKFLALQIHGMHTADAFFLYEKMKEYPDLYLEIDMKRLNAEKATRYATRLVETFAHDEEALGRLLIQINSEKMYEAIDAVYHFPYYQFNVVRKRYEAGQLGDILSYCKEKGICAVALKGEYASAENIACVKAAGLSLLVYAIDSRKRAEMYLARGADTICTNYIDLFWGQKGIDPEEIEALYQEYHKEPVQQNKIVFSNFHGAGFGCNPKYIALALLEQKTENLDLVWLSRNPDTEVLPEGMRTVFFHSREAIREIATARVLVENQMKFPGFVKRKDQFLVQAWHGAIPLKKLAMDNPKNRFDREYATRLDTNMKQTDLILSNSNFCTDMFRRGFEYTGYILKEGAPRNDLFLKDMASFKEQICDMLHIPYEKKLFLYAPTFREGNGLDTYQIDYNKILEQLGEDWVILIRLHPHIQKKAGFITYHERIINASVVPDMQQLLAAVDLLVTDYSNIMFEYMLTKRPCILYATDVEEYRKERDYYFEIDALPFPLTTTTDELVHAITVFDQESYEQKIEAFKKKVGLHETGQAAEKTAQIILQMIKEQDFTFQGSNASLEKKHVAKVCAARRKCIVLIWRILKRIVRYSRKPQNDR